MEPNFNLGSDTSDPDCVLREEPPGHPRSTDSHEMLGGKRQGKRCSGANRGAEGRPQIRKRREEFENRERQKKKLEKKKKKKRMESEEEGREEFKGEQQERANQEKTEAEPRVKAKEGAGGAVQGESHHLEPNFRS